MRMFTVDDVFGGWARAQAEHFADGAIYDRLFLAASGAPRRP
jgi:sulfate transport system substrate-binding protein